MTSTPFPPSAAMSEFTRTDDLSAQDQLDAVDPPADLDDPDLSPNAITVLERRYLKKDLETDEKRDLLRFSQVSWDRILTELASRVQDKQLHVEIHSRRHCRAQFLSPLNVCWQRRMRYGRNRIQDEIFPGQ